MVRNMLLFISSAAVLALIFFGYNALFTPQSGPLEIENDPAEVVPNQSVADADPLAVAQGVQMPGEGERIKLTLYDEFTGRPKQEIELNDWYKVPGVDNQIVARDIRMTMLLPNGQRLTIASAEGRIEVDRVSREEMRPESGALIGGTTITLDRNTHPQRSPIEERPADAVTISMDGEVTFDVELGEMKTPGHVQVASADFRIEGDDLELLWNATDNRLESLILSKGGELWMREGIALLSGNESDPNAPESQRAVSDFVTYFCRLEGAVEAQQRVGGQAVGGFEADGFHLLYDVGQRVGRALGKQESEAPEDVAKTGDQVGEGQAIATSEDQSAADQAAQPREMVATWKGKLSITPRGMRRGTKPQREFEAFGQAVHMWRGASGVRCGRLEFRESSNQIWLYARESTGRIAFDLQRGVTASAGEAYVDVANDVVKLIGDVELLDQRRSSGGASGLTIQADQWAELLLSDDQARDATLPDEALSADGIREAVFVGDVAIVSDDQQLAAQRVQLYFDQSDPNASMEQRFERAVASGTVRLTAAEGDWLSQVGRGFQDSLNSAFGGRSLGPAGVVQQLACDALEVNFEQDALKQVYPSTAQATGAVELWDRASRVMARGRDLDAEFLPDGRVAHATVQGDSSSQAWVFADPFQVQGQRVELTPPTQSLEVPGASELLFETRDDFGAFGSGEPRLMQITCNDSLAVVGPENVVRFKGDVVASSGDEHLAAEEMVLQLRDAAVPETTDQVQMSLVSAVKRYAFTSTSASPAADGPRLLGRSRDVATVRKEPTRLVATVAAMISEQYRSGDSEPVVHMSVTSPLLEVDVLERIIYTSGGTQLLMTSRQLGSDTRTETAGFGVPSALSTRGPHQTAIACEGRMTYTLGSRAARRDHVAFDGGVRFIHAAGREMVNFEQMLPEVQSNPELLVKIEDRKTFLQSNRLEVEFALDNGRAGQASGMRLANLQAIGDVYLRDRQGDGIREATGDRLAYQAEAAKVYIEGNPANIAYENPKTNLSNQVRGRYLEMDLKANDVRTTGPTEGSFFQP
jgi:lipopolysaccharide export system protein LptA